jgi:hypothetical protein
MMLLHLGIIRSSANLTLLPDTEAIQHEIRLLDMMPNKDILRTMVLYLKYPEQPVEEVLGP